MASVNGEAGLGGTTRNPKGNCAAKVECGVNGGMYSPASIPKLGYRFVDNDSPNPILTAFNWNPWPQLIPRGAMRDR